jgi:sulfur-oxidizing protein SoxA
MLEDGNPAELFEAQGESLWTQRRGPRNATLEGCDLGKGPGVVKGAFVELPRYFADAGRVMDLETRLVHCMQTCRAWTPRSSPGRISARGSRSTSRRWRPGSPANPED